MENNRSIFISAGDPSADYYGKCLIDAMSSTCGMVSSFGLGGPLMQQAGLRPLADHNDLAVLGFWEIIPKLFYFRQLLKKTAREIEQARPKVVILIDYPGFNLRLAERIKHLQIPIVYYISPQVWAWGKGRVAKIKRLIDLMLVIFPFEEKFYQSQDIKAIFSGHPIVDRYAAIPGKDNCQKSLGFSRKTIALLPGSRVQEVRRMLPEMVAAAGRIREKMQDVDFVIAGVSGVPPELYENIIKDAGIPVVVGKTPEIMNAADLVIVSSGTATVETAFFTTPMIVIYKTGAITYQIAKRLVKLDAIGMVNIVAGQKIAPELIQRQATAAAIAAEAVEILSDASRYAQMVMDLRMVKEKLGSGDAAMRAFREINKVAGIC